MTVTGSTYYNLSDFRSITLPNGTVAAVAEMLNKMKPILDNLPWRQCNTQDKHSVALRTNLPTATTIQAGGGVPLDKSNYTHVTEVTAAVGVGHQVHRDVLEASGNPEAQRALAARGAIESIASKVESLMIGGDVTADPLSFNGLKTRLSSTSGELADRVIKGVNSDADVNTSIYFVVGGEGLTYGLHPAQFPMGLMADLGKTAYPVTNSAGRVSYVYTDTWKWHCGLAIEDPRSVARICNINTTKLASGTGDDDLFALMLDGYHAVKKVLGRPGSKPMILVNPTVCKYLEKQARANVTFNDLSVESRDGMPVTTYRGIPILESDYILNTEALVS